MFWYTINRLMMFIKLWIGLRGAIETHWWLMMFKRKNGFYWAPWVILICFSFQKLSIRIPYYGKDAIDVLGSAKVLSRGPLHSWETQKHYIFIFFSVSAELVVLTWGRKFLYVWTPSVFSFCWSRDLNPIKCQKLRYLESWLSSLH